MKARKKKAPVEVTPHNLWWCESCGDGTEMTHPEFMEHLKGVHGLETKGLKCRKSMLMHLDGDTWFSWKYEVIIATESGELKALNDILSRRSKDDMMRYGGDE